MKIKYIPFIFLLLPWFIAKSQTKEGLQIINGTYLFVTEAGKGEVLIVIHGGPGLNHSYFRPYLDPLTEKFKVIYYDQRACGQSAIPSVDSLSLAFFIHDIEGIRKILGVEKVNLLAHSWGALLAVQYGMKYPAHIGKMIVSNPIPLNLEYQQESLKNLQSHSTPQDSIDRAEILASEGWKDHEVSAYEKMLEIIFRPSFYDRAALDNIDFNIPENYQSATTALYQGLGKELQAYDFYEDVKAFSFPVLLIAGSADNIPMKAIQRIQENIPESKLIVFEKSGHFPFVEETDAFNKVVTTFLKK